MQCSIRRCKNLATVMAGHRNTPPTTDVPLCDACLDALRQFARNQDDDPDDEDTGFRISPCPSL